MREFNYVAENEKKVMIDGHVYPLKPGSLGLIDKMLDVKSAAESSDQIAMLKAEYSAVTAMLGGETTEIVLGSESECDLHKLEALFEFVAQEYKANESAD